MDGPDEVVLPQEVILPPRTCEVDGPDEMVLPQEVISPPCHTSEITGAPGAERRVLEFQYFVAPEFLPKEFVEFLDSSGLCGSNILDGSCAKVSASVLSRSRAAHRWRCV